MTGQQRPTCVWGKRRDGECSPAQSGKGVAVQIGATVKTEAKKAMCRERREGLMIKRFRQIKTKLKLMGINCIID